MAMASTGLQHPVTKAGTHFIVSCILLFNTSFHTGCIPVIHAVIAELPEQTLRAKSQLVAQFTNTAVGVGISYATPYMFRADAANLGPKVGFVFLPIDIYGALFTYFFMPEIKGRSLEEIDLLFLSKISARDSKKWKPESTSAGLIELIPDSKMAGLENSTGMDDKYSSHVQHIERLPTV
jgi:SP family sugar:H+ symporter-like MFS transporter